MGLAALGGVGLSGLSWSALSAVEAGEESAPKRRPLVVQPVFFYMTASRRPETSWRWWGGIETQAQADDELSRIRGEIKKLEAGADFPVQFLPIVPVRDGSPFDVKSLGSADVVLVYAAGGNRGPMDALADSGKDVIFFLRHKSGPLYFYYEAISPWTLRKAKYDQLAAKGVNEEDVVVDSQGAILWRLRALCGLRNTVGSRIVAIGGPNGWGIGPKAAELAKARFQLDIRSVSYEQLKALFNEAAGDQKAADRARRRAAEYLELPGTTLETEKGFLERSFLLTDVFLRLMREAECSAITISGCMSTPMPIAKTTACVSLSVLNDAGYLAFCESDFVVIPAGMLLANISGKPVFLNDPTYPHDGVITLAHCTAPRKMDGKTSEPARILTHFESDYGAAPKVEMRKGQVVTNILPGFEATRWAGLLGEIVDHPFLPICRSQIDIRFQADSLLVARRMPGFHWITGYGDHTKELGYAARRVGIAFDRLR
jgi:hypothetical protein